MDTQEDCFHLGVKGIIRNKEGKLLLLQLTKDGKELWDIPGGRIQKKESIEEALKREIYEETGLKNIINIRPFVMTLSSRRISLQKGDVGLILATYLCDIVGDLFIYLSGEHERFGWFDPSTAAQLLMIGYPTELTEKLAKLS